MILQNLLPLFLVGSLAGFLAGFFGVGGGVILGPFLLFFFQARGIPVDIATRLAFGTSHFCAMFNSIFGVRWHQRQGNVLWKIVLRIALSAIVGAYIGSYLATIMPGEILKRILAFILIILAVQIFVGFGKTKGGTLSLSWSKTIPIGFFAGFFAALGGIGGGVFFVPAMILFLHVPVKKTAGTSSAIIIFTALSGSIGYLTNGSGVPGRPFGSIGYVDILATIPILAGSLIFSQLGGYLNSILPAKFLRPLFGLFLIAIFIKLAFF